MKSLELKNFGVHELDAMELKEIDGGGFPFWAIGVAFYLYDNRDRVLVGVKKGLNDFL